MESDPDSDRLERLETCFARLLRGPSEVFKLRKPICLRIGEEVVDLSSIEARRRACQQEERLGRILAPDLVLGVRPLVRDAEGVERVGNEGRIVDWALHMRRLPDEERADRRLAAGTLEDDHLYAIARHLAAFHAEARELARPPPPYDALGRLRALVDLRITSPDAPAREREPAELATIEARQHELLESHAERLQRRARDGTIRESHGELTLEHVFVAASGEVRILAGLEMAPLLRPADVAADVAFLASDLAAHRRVDLAERFVAEYARSANDFDLYPLLDFHASLRAALRGKIDWHCATVLARDERTSRRYRERARRFFALALAAPRRPLLPAAVVAMGGQVASGKSTLASEIARRIGAPVVSADATRDFLLGARPVDAPHEIRWEESFSADFPDRCYAEVLRRAGEVLESGRPVVIDGCFRSRAQRVKARLLAERYGRPFLFAEAWVSTGLQRERLSERALRDDVPLAAWQGIADALRASWEPADELDDEEHLRLDTALPLEASLEQLESRLPTWPETLRG